MAQKKWIFLSILIIALIIGIVIALNGKKHNSKNQDLTFNTLDNNSKEFKIANVWSHDGSPISPNPPTPPEKNTFLPTENIYAVIKTTGTGSITVRIYIVENEAWKEGALMNDVSPDGYNEVTITATQNPQYHGPFLVWEHPLEIGQYDIVVDEDLDGIRDPGEKVDDSNIAPGVFVVPDLTSTLTGFTAFISAYGLYSLRKRKK